MKFLGIDFGWQNKPTGLARLAWDGSVLRLTAFERRTGLAEVLEWVDASAGNQAALVAVDAPTLIPNAAGMRVPDRLTHNHFGRYHAGSYPANQGSIFAALTTELGRELEQRGYRHADVIAPQRPGRFQIEVFPHPAIVNLFSLDRIIRYKKGRVASRSSELGRYRDLVVDVLPRLDPPLERPNLPPVPAGGRALKELEDQLDALLCAYIGAHWWYWGAERNLVLGSAADGYMIVPARRQLELSSGESKI